MLCVYSSNITWDFTELLWGGGDCCIQGNHYMCHVCIYMYVCVFMCMCVCVHVCVPCVYVNMCVCLCMHCACVCMWCMCVCVCHVCVWWAYSYSSDHVCDLICQQTLQKGLWVIAQHFLIPYLYHVLIPYMYRYFPPPDQQWLLSSLFWGHLTKGHPEVTWPMVTLRSPDQWSP